MTAKEIMTPIAASGYVENKQDALRSIPSDMPLVEVLPLVLESPVQTVKVNESGTTVGIITGGSLLEGLGRFIAARDDSSYLTVVCAPHDYSASMIAHAVEDADAHLNDLWSKPDADGNIRVTLRVGHNDPSSVARNLERYGFTVIDTFASAPIQNETLATERLLALRTLLNV